MGFINLNADLNAVTSEFPVAPAGTYPCQITKVEEGESQSGNPKLVIGLTPTVPIECASGTGSKTLSGVELFRASVSLQPQALFTLKELLLAAKVSFTPQGFDKDALLGQQVMVKVTKEQDKEDKSRWFNKVKKFMPMA